MSTINRVESLLASFDCLSATEKLVIAREIGKRILEGAGDRDITLESELEHVSGELFQMLDREEEANGAADSASW